MVELRVISNIDTVDLEPIGIFPLGQAPLSGSPSSSEHELSDDGHVQTGVWECTPGSFRWGTEGFCELMHFTSGDVTITADDGTVHRLTAGDVLFVPEGWSGVWEVHSTVRKSYTIVQTS
jgi:uncharacterized protein